MKEKNQKDFTHIVGGSRGSTVVELEIEDRINSILIEVAKEIHQDLIISSKQTIRLLLNQKNGSDLISLYTFYYYTAKWQKTNQPKATIPYVMKGLKWGRDKVRERKQQLISLGLIEEVRRKNNNSKYLGWYIKISYIFGKNTILDKSKSLKGLLVTNKTTPLKTSRLVSKTTPLKNYPPENQYPNALRVRSENALREESKNSSFFKKAEDYEKGARWGEKPFYNDQEMRFVKGEWFVEPKGGWRVHPWIEFNDSLKKIEWK